MLVFSFLTPLRLRTEVRAIKANLRRKGRQCPHPGPDLRGDGKALVEDIGIGA